MMRGPLLVVPFVCVPPGSLLEYPLVQVSFGFCGGSYQRMNRTVFEVLTDTGNWGVVVAASRRHLQFIVPPPPPLPVVPGTPWWRDIPTIVGICRHLRMYVCMYHTHGNIRFNRLHIP
jgi:hypothetical protein